MRRFADLYDELDNTTSTNARVAAITRYLAGASEADAAWAMFFLTGQRLKRVVGWKDLRDLVLEEAGLAPWLLEECYSAVGDLAETIALLVETAKTVAPEDDVPLHTWVEERVLPLRDADASARADALRAMWRRLPPRELFIVHKMLTGELRVGVSKTLAMRALAEHAGLAAAVVAHRLMDFTPSAAAYRAAMDPAPSTVDLAQPYPFCLAHPFEAAIETLGAREEWIAEWKWDGIRAQLIRRGGAAVLWSRGEERIDERFPEIMAAARSLPDGTVLDGEVLAMRDGQPLPFGALQRRIGRKKLTRSVLAEVPIALLVFDVLESEGRDVRAEPLEARRAILERIAIAHGGPTLRISPIVDAPTFEELARLRETARERGVEGFMLKRRGSPYGAGRKKGEWWKWKIDPLTVDVVLIYARPGHGKRASLLTDYGFGVWDGNELTPVAQAYSGLDDAEIAELDRWIRAHTTERRGPVRIVEPLHVFELGFEAIRRSARHKSGVALRFPRILRWRRDKLARDADTLENLHAILAAHAFEPPRPPKPRQLGLFDDR